MTVHVTIEGSRITRSTALAAGERRKVVLTKSVQALIDRGFVTVVERVDVPDPEPVADPDAAEGESSENGSEPDTPQVEAPETEDEKPSARRAKAKPAASSDSTASPDSSDG